MRKKLIILILFLLIPIFQGEQPPLDPSNNAVWHNALGLNYMEDGNIQAAITEYKIAIALKADKSVSSAFHNNLGLAYLKIGRPDWAILCFENAITLNPNCFYFYENLVKAYSAAHQLGWQYNYYSKKTRQNFENSYNWMMLGLIQEQLGHRKEAIKSFNNYILLEPELVVSQAVRSEIEKIKQAE